MITEIELTRAIVESVTVRKPREACVSAVKLGIKNLPVLQGG
jgi:hypothetical protein